MTSRLRAVLLAWSGTFTLATAVRAQCADGSQPPCRSARPPARPTVAMDDRTWIVLPFDNQAHVTDLDWLTDASVNLLTMDLSRWTDVHAVDDKRIADFLRDVPAVRAKQRLSLNDGLGVARRAGAGKLVMGEFLKIGSRTVVTAASYNARTGTRLRTARHETTVADSLLPLFGKVASDLLGVPPPAGANVGTVGTTRADAYQAYIAGVAALNRFDIPEAKRRFEAALKLDTAFALAHYKLAITSIFDESAQNERQVAQAAKGNSVAALAGQPDSTRLAYASAAARLSATLPPRERALINGLLAQTRHDFARACDLYAGLVRADSNDVEALYGVGACTFSDDAIEFAGGDTLRPTFRGNWNTTLRVSRRALSVDPTYHLAFANVLSVLSASTRTGCRRDDPALPCARGAPRYFAAVRRDGDSLVAVPSRLQMNQALIAQLADRNPARLAQLDAAWKAAEEWVAAGPREGRAHKTLGRLLLRLGRLEEADRSLSEAAALLPPDPFSEITLARLEIALKRGRSADVRRLMDSVATAAPNDFIRTTYHALLSPVLGQIAKAEAGMRGLMRTQGTASQLPPAMMQQFESVARIVLGVAGDSAVRVETTVLTMFRSQDVCAPVCQSLLGPNFTFGLRMPRPRFPAFDSTVTDRRFAVARALAAGDTVRVRVAARMLDSATQVEARLGLPEEGSSIVAIEGYLILRDTVSALRVARRMLDTTMVFAPLEAPFSGLSIAFSGSLWPRAILLRADLEAARGDKSVARTQYKRFADLWEQADPEFKPMVDRAKKAYRDLGGT